MPQRKDRLTVTVDRSLVEAGQRAVKQGSASSLSGWVNLALVERAEKEQRLSAMAEALAVYEGRFGEISDSELRAQARADRESAVVVRGPRRKKGAA